MLFKIPLRNIKRSIRDYAIYFFTLIIGVSVFYVFNAIGGQAAMLRIGSSNKSIIEILKIALSYVSVIVAVVLALLIVYASRFLMKRRNKEFAIYMTLGMGKGKISAIMLIETLIIGIGSLFVGLILGIGLSQLMSAVVAGFFEADMTAYTLSVSTEAIGLTILYFAIMYLMVMIFNVFAVTKMKLIDLIASGRKAEKISMKNPILCVGVFIVSLAALIWAYIRVTDGIKGVDQITFSICTGILCVTTGLIFWSLSGLLLRILKSMKNTYFRGLNAFTFRQISSRINTMVLSMTIICIMLFLTICSLSGAFAVRNSLNRNLQELCPVDFQLEYFRPHYENAAINNDDCAKLYRDYGHDITDGFSDYVQFTTYEDQSLTVSAFLGDKQDPIKEQYPYLYFDSWETIIRVSDYNKLMHLYNREEISLGNDEYVLLCDYSGWKTIRDSVLSDGGEIRVFGKTLHSKYRECQDGFINIGAQRLNIGVFVVPDDAVAEDAARVCYFTGNYAGDTKEEKEAVESMQRKRFKDMRTDWLEKHNGDAFSYSLNTKIDIYEAAIGLGAIAAFLGLYIGVVFLIACGAILALKCLSESVDSVPRYDMLRKVGAEEPAIQSSLFRQTSIFFLLPLVLAMIHSIFGLKFAEPILETAGTEMIGESFFITGAVILIIYGGYFLITYFSSKRIIK